MTNKTPKDTDKKKTTAPSAKKPSAKKPSAKKPSAKKPSAKKKASVKEEINSIVDMSGLTPPVDESGGPLPPFEFQFPPINDDEIDDIIEPPAKEVEPRKKGKSYALIAAFIISVVSVIFFNI